MGKRQTETQANDTRDPSATRNKRNKPTKKATNKKASTAGDDHKQVEQTNKINVVKTNTFHSASMPENWLTTIENIRIMRDSELAPVDTMGCAQASSQQDSKRDQRFQTLTALMLSSQTKDPVTWAACQRLRSAGYGHVMGVLNAQESDIANLIYPVSFYKRKAVYMQKVAKILHNNYEDDIPKTVEDLCNLPGVGPKMAHLCMQAAWDQVTGIGVDTHVHRISQRLHWVPANVKNPEQTRKALEAWLPREYWAEINHLLVGFGQTVCTPLRPKCKTCANANNCPSVKW